jgi:energy-coupling factor transport system ATP-binding protein
VLDPANERELELIRRHLATVLQNPDDQIISSVVEEDTAFGPENQGLPEAEKRKRVDEALKRTGLENHRQQPVRSLSGGERQRLALAGVLALDTKIIVLDEAVSMLDPKGRDDFLELLDELSAAGKTIIQVTHSLEEASFCSRCLALYKGRLVFDGTPEELLKNPELENWGFALPEAVKVFQSFSSGVSLFSMDAGIAADQIAVALEARVKIVRNAVPAVTEKVTTAESAAVTGNVAASEKAVVSFINASHRYSPAFPGGMTDVSFDAAPGELIALIGRSGSGKSTVLKHINALLLPKEGSVFVLDKDTLDRETRLAALRMNAALSIQSPESALFERYVADDVAYGPRNGNCTGGELVRRVKAAMEKTGLPFKEFGDREIRTLSGGEKRRAAIAGTAAMESRILLLDEPLAGLDGFHQKKILDLIHSFRLAGKTVIISTHSMETAVLADKVAVMAAGKLAAFGTPREIFGPGWNPLWGLSLPWVTAVSRNLAARGYITAGVPLVAEELLSCLQGLSVPSASPPRQHLPDSSNGRHCRIQRGVQDNGRRRTARRPKTGVEFFKNVSFGEFLDRPSFLRDLGAARKLTLLCILAAAVLAVPHLLVPLSVLFVIVIVGFIGGRIGPKHLLNGLIPIAPCLAILVFLQFLFSWPDDQSVRLLVWGHFSLTVNELNRVASLACRLAALTTLQALYTAVTPLRDMLKVIQKGLSPLSRIGLPVRDISLSLGIALRFVPVLIEEAERIVTAQISRGGGYNGKGRIRAALAMIVPLFLRALERAETLANAIVLRHYRTDGQKQ